MKRIILLSAIAGMMAMTSCMKDGDDSIILEDAETDIPSDASANPNPDIYGDINASIPNIKYTTVDENGNAVIRLDLTGVQNRENLEWIRLYGTGDDRQNVWVEVDGKPKGIRVYNTADDADAHSVPVDLVFLVDNSGSMDDEANAIARDIAAWATKLENAGLDIRFAYVGYDGAINGACELTDAETFEEYLNGNGYGTNHTVGFNAKSSSLRYDLQNNVGSYRTGGNSSNECGMAALRYATDNIPFRNNSNRIYVNFTDEPNQDAGIHRFDVESLLTDWDPALGTVHTVYSNGDYYSNNEKMSEYTGGTVIRCNSSFYGVTLESLPVTDAMTNSYIIRFTDIEEYLDGRPHTVKITILEPDGSVKAEREYTVIFNSTPVLPDGSESDSYGSTDFNGGFGKRD